MTYVDALTGCLCSSNWQHTRACHLMADTEVELMKKTGWPNIPIHVKDE